MRERACMKDASTPQPSMLRLIRNAAALAAASPTWLLSGWSNAARLKRNMSELLGCDGTPVAVSAPRSPGGAVEKGDAKIRRARRGGSGHIGGEKRKVLIVSVLLPVAIDLALRSKTQRRIEVLRMREKPILLNVAT